MVWEVQDKLVVVQAVAVLDAEDAMRVRALRPVEVPVAVVLSGDDDYDYDDDYDDDDQEVFW